MNLKFPPDKLSMEHHDLRLLIGAITDCFVLSFFSLHSPLAARWSLRTRTLSDLGTFNVQHQKSKVKLIVPDHKHTRISSTYSTIILLSPF